MQDGKRVGDHFITTTLNNVNRMIRVKLLEYPSEIPTFIGIFTATIRRLEVKSIIEGYYCFDLTCLNLLGETTTGCDAKVEI